MDMRCLCLVLFSVTAIVTGQTCSSGYPTAYMCQDSTVQGHMVTLDISQAADTKASECSCSLQANISGVIVQFDSYPQTSECDTQIYLQFQEKSIMFRCGAPIAAETSQKSTATITYKLDLNATNPDSSYCMTFNGSTTDINLILTCSAPAPSSTLSTITTTTSSTASLTTSVLPLTSSQTTTTSSSTSTTTSSTTSPTTSSILPLSSSQTTTLSSTTSLATTPSGSGNSSTTSKPTLQTTSTKTTDQDVTTDNSLNTATTTEASTTTGVSVTFTTTDGDMVTITESQTSTASPNVTTAFENTTASTITVNTDTTSDSVMAVNTTESNVTTITTTMPSNMTTIADNTIDNITMTTASPQNETATDNTTSVNITELTTDKPDNVTTVADNTTANNVTDLTTVTVIPDNVTTVADNTTADNVTADNTTSTSPGFWEPPDYEADSPKSSNLVIILPLVCICLVGFVGGVVFIIVKRTRKAAKKQRERSKEAANKPKPNKPNDATKPQENPFLISNYHPVTENGTADQKNKTAEKEQVKNKKDDKYTEKNKTGTLNNKTNVAVTHENNNKPAHHYKKNETQKALKVYEPTEYEKDVLDKLELTSIVIEPDPADPNRYFKKENPGDWYRLIMKGKKAKDSDELGNTSASKSGTKERRRSKSSKSGSDSKSEDSSRDKRTDKRRDKSKRKQKSKSDISETMKSNGSLDSWDELDETIHDKTNGNSDNAPKTQPRLVVSRPMSDSDSVGPTSTPAPRVIMSQPKLVTTPSSGNIAGNQKLVQMRPASGVARQPQTGAQPIRAASPGAVQQSGIRTVSAKRPEIVPPLNL